MNICGLLNVPDIPAEILAEYPYVLITKNDDGSNVLYNLFATSNRWRYMNRELFESAVGVGALGNADGCIESIGEPLMVVYGCYENESSWTFALESNDILFPVGPVSDSSVTTLIWSNYDIYTATGIDFDSGTTIVGTEIYFHEYQNFNGVWLPKIPEDVLAEYPYAVIIDDREKETGVNSGLYMLIHTKDKLTYIPSALSGEAWGQLASNSNGFKQYAVILSQGIAYWMLVSEAELFQNMPVEVGDYDGNEQFYIHWSNHDIYTAISYDSTSGSTTLGSEIYFPNSLGGTSKPTRYSIAGAILEDIASQIRRLTSTENKIKPEDMEPMLESVQPAPELLYAEEVEFG